MRPLLLLSLSLLLACGDSGSSSSGGGGAPATGGQDTGGSTSEAGGAGGVGAGASPGGADTSGGGGVGGASSSFAAESLALCDVINAYRVSLGLPEVPVSVALTTVAEAHVADLAANPGTLTPPCNLHSWSDQGAWSGCCYTPDHAEAECMWSKPEEITAGWGANAYTGNGYEISASGASTPEQALELWKTSQGHHDVILNAAGWANFSPWPAMGCGMGSGFAMVWFGDAVDLQSL